MRYQPAIEPSPTLTDEVQARIALPFGDGGAPQWIMWMPGGTHTISARRKGKPVQIRVNVDRAGAESAERSLREHLSAGRQRPFFDFAHEGKAASAWPLEFSWRDGSDPGIYSRVEWSQAGAAAIVGKEFRAFSPTFFATDADPARIDGCPLNCGGLVNDPAFKEISPIWARHAAADSDNDSKTNDGMDELTAKTELAALQARITELETVNAELTAQAQSAETQAAIEAKDAEIAELKRRNDEVQREMQARRERDADALVASAVSRGAIAAKDTETQKKWRGLVIADPANADLVNKLPGRAAVTAGRIAGSRPIEIIKLDTNDCIRAYHAAATPLDKGLIYRREFHPILEKGERIPFERYPIEADNTLGTVAGNLIAQRVLDLMVSRRPMIQNVVSDFSSEQARKGQTVYTRTVGVPAVQNFGSGAVDTADTDYPVQLANHKEVHYAFTAAEYLSTNRNLVEERAQAMAVGLGNHIVDAIAALITDAFTSETTGAAGDKDFTALSIAAAALNAAGAPDMNRAMWVSSAFATALVNEEMVLYKSFGGDAKSAYGHWTNIKGFDHVWEFPALPANAVNLIGFAFHRNALIIAARVADNPERLVGAGYAGTLQVITDPVTGLSVLSDRWITQATRAINTRLDVLYGVARGVVAAGHKFVTS